MSTSLFGLIEMLGVFGLVLGVVGWQIWDWQRWRQRRDAERDVERDAQRDASPDAERAAAAELSAHPATPPAPSRPQPPD